MRGFRLFRTRPLPGRPLRLHERIQRRVLPERFVSLFIFVVVVVVVVVVIVIVVADVNNGKICQN